MNNNSVKTLKTKTFDANTTLLSNPKDNVNQPIQEVIIFDDLVICDRCKKKVEIGILTILFNEMNKGEQLKSPEYNRIFIQKLMFNVVKMLIILYFMDYIIYIIFQMIM